MGPLMEPGDGEWIRGETADPAGDGGWPEHEWPPPDPPPESERRWGHGGVPGFSVRAAAAVAVVAAVAAAGIAVWLFPVRGTPTASAAGGATPGASAPRVPATLPGLPGTGNGQLRMLLTGRVLAVSATSITIGGGGPPVTAAVTSATTITGTARRIGSVKVGDQVVAQLTGTASHLAATAIQDPAQ